MLTAVGVLDALVERPEVSRVVLLGGAQSLGAGGAIVPLDASLRALLSATRPLFFDCRPRVASVLVGLREGALWLVPCGRNVLVVHRRTADEGGFALTELESTTLAQEIAAAPAVSPCSAAARAGIDGATEAAFLLGALNTVLGTLKVSVGGAVLRNYARRAQRELSPQHPVVDAVSLDLGGVARWTSVELPEVSGKGEGIRALVDSIKARAALVAPEVEAIDVDGLFLEQRAIATAIGFRRGDAAVGAGGEVNEERACPQKENAT